MENVTFGSVCSGIEAASVAWEPLGFRASWFAEIEPFPSAVLAYHWPHVSNLGDMTKIAERIGTGEVEAPSILVGGTPCQAFSVAGMRNSLDDARGKLTLEYVRLADAIDSRRQSIGLDKSIIVWENVPGVLNTKDNVFGCFLGALAGEECELQPAGKKWGNAGCVFGPKRAIAWRVLDAQYFGVAQRRRRVFVVASARKGFDPSQVLFEFDGVRRDIAPGREKGETVAALTANGVGTCGADDNQAQAGHLISMAHGQGGAEVRADGLVPCLTCNHEAPIIAHCSDVAPTMGASGPPFSRAGNSRVEADALVVSVHGTQSPIVANDRAHCLGRNNGQENVILYGVQVRRLTPRECERLQGFPDDHTLVPFGRPVRPEKMDADYAKYLMRGGNKTFEECLRAASDSHRYKALGNSMAVPCMAWIGSRINAFLTDQSIK